ncbi:MAG: hypothetical protein U0T83_08515 [Bacteriovoracaceae bacterium]
MRPKPSKLARSISRSAKEAFIQSEIKKIQAKIDAIELEILQDY